MQTLDELEVRDGTVGDLQELRRILTAAAEPARAALPPAAFDVYLDMVLALEDRLSVAELVVVTARGRPIGTVTFFPDAADEGWGWPPGLAGLRSMAVDPDAQGRGAGMRLLDECRRRAIANGAAGLALHTAHFLRAAIRLYERYGFVRVPGHDVRAAQVMDLPDPSHDYVGLAYRLDLPD